ncbi:unnamed protein product [Schistosoma curassoni]|uniref:Secreted protein n=1 Tax=Schistosoma curassoni TaxID=6186 RepID=A0A183JD97_9TREM|nr:unnamed protein product [Schistosoma curassoni]
MMAVVVLHVSAPYSRTIWTFVLKILTLMLACRQLFSVPYVLQLYECDPCFADLHLYVCIRSSLFINDAAIKICERSRMFQGFSIKCD